LNELSQCAGDDSTTLTEPTANVDPIPEATHQSRILAWCPGATLERFSRGWEDLWESLGNALHDRWTARGIAPQMSHQRDHTARLGRLRVILAAGPLALIGVTGCGPATPVSEPTTSIAVQTPAAELTTVPTATLGASSTASGRIAFSVGDIFAGIGDGKFNRFDPTGALTETLDDGQVVPGENATTGMCFDPVGNMYATNVRANSMSQFSNDGTLLAATFGTFNAQPESCLIIDGKTMFTSEVAGTGDILRLDLSGKQLANYDVRRSDWIDLAADRCTMYYTDEGPAIHRFDVCTNSPLKDFVTRGGGYFALRILPDGTILVAATSAVKRFSSSGTEIASYTAPGENFFFALNLDPDGVHFWSGGIRTGTIYRFVLTPVGPPVLSFSAQVAKSGGTELAGLAVFGELVASQATSVPTLAPTIGATSPIATVPNAATASENAPPAGLLAIALLVLVLAVVVVLVLRSRKRYSAVRRGPPPDGGRVG
jgi:hypothetical protein